MMRPTLAIDCFDIEVLPSLSIFWSTRIPGCADVGVHKMRTGRQSERWNAAHRRMDSRAAKVATFRPSLAANHNPDGTRGLVRYVLTGDRAAAEPVVAQLVKWLRPRVGLQGFQAAAATHQPVPKVRRSL